MVIAGVMSGSSLDGLDVALVEFNEDGSWELKATYEKAYSKEWEERLRDYFSLDAQAYIQLKYEYSYTIGNILKELFRFNKVRADYISFHGHTLVHNPREGYTEQIGNGGIIAGVTNVSTITDFRNQDIALEGQGTPLAPLVERDLFPGYDYYLNLGGIANITKVTQSSIEAYDICPCNQLLNHFSLKLGKPYDSGGEFARKGTFDASLQDYFKAEPFFEKKPPKSLDNNWIREKFIADVPKSEAKDVLYNYCLWMAEHIAKHIKHAERQTRLFISGGGSHNSFFIDKLRKALENRKCELIVPSKELIDFKEAILMSLLGYKYLNDEANVLSSVTGASKNSIGGALHKV